MIGSTLSRYLAKIFARWILGFFMVGSAIIFLADFVELLRRSFDNQGLSAGGAFLTSVLRTPSLAEEFLPFAVLFGAIGAFLTLNRQLELVVLRAAGLSVWQFLLPPLLVGAAIGIVATLIYNPVSSYGRDKADSLAIAQIGAEQRVLSGSTGDIWFRQEGVDGASILNARGAASDGTTLFDVIAYTFDRSGAVSDRIQAATALLDDGRWALHDATVYGGDGDRSHVGSYLIPTYLTPAQVRSTIARPTAISFWQLPGIVHLAERAGLTADRYRMQFQTLLARPLLLAAMVLVAATVSLRLVRLGGTSQAVIGGVVAGFVLYVAREVAGDLGSAGLVSPTFAAWTPGIAALLFGATSLLRTEDG